MVTLANLRSMCGHVVERATLARDLLAPAASRLSGDDPTGGGLHSRCVLAQRLGWFFPQIDDVRADLEPFGTIEAIALCETVAAAVVVFRDEASVAVTLRRQEETSAGLYSAVPPPYLALPLRFIHPDRIQVALYPPPTPLPTTEAVPISGAGRQTIAEPMEGTRTEASAHPTYGVPPLWMQYSPVILLQNPPTEQHSAAPSTTRFVPSRKSQILGPTLGADGHLWMDGCNVTQYDRGVHIEKASIRVVPVPPPHY